MTNTSTPENIHHGRNLKRLREMLGVKQEALALSLGEDWSQKKISRLEDQKIIEEDILHEVSKALHVTPEAIKNFDEQAAVNYFNSFHDNSVSHVIGNYGKYNFNPVDVWLQTLDENKKLYQDKVELYERMLKDKDEMIARLELLISQRK